MIVHHFLSCIRTSTSKSSHRNYLALLCVGVTSSSRNVEYNTRSRHRAVTMGIFLNVLRRVNSVLTGMHGLLKLSSEGSFIEKITVNYLRYSTSTYPGVPLYLPTWKTANRGKMWETKNGCFGRREQTDPIFYSKSHIFSHKMHVMHINLKNNSPNKRPYIFNPFTQRKRN